VTHFTAYDRLFGSSRGQDIFTENAHLAAMLRVEAALARAEATLGMIPAKAAETIISCCNIDGFDRAALAEGSASAGNLAIPLVKQLTSIVRALSAEAAGYVHWGATSQDVIDTATILQLREHLKLLGELIDAVCVDLAELTTKHRCTLMAGRTWLQHAVPITFGLKTAGWLDSFLRHRERLAELKPRVLTLQFGGAAGTLASLGSKGPAVTAMLAKELQLSLPSIPWHANRDRFAEVATFQGILVGTLGKIARDLSLSMQTEIGELAEAAAEGRGGSSTMPHKKNPVTAAILLSASVRVPGLVSTMLSAMVQEHERGLGGWHAEWEALPEICALTSGAIESFATMLPQLSVFPDAMRRNLDVTKGLVSSEAVSMALAAHTGRDVAHELVEEASRHAQQTNVSLRVALGENPAIRSRLSEAELDAVVDPANYLGAAGTMIDSVLAAYHSAFPSNRKER
jgi:3-carboxy-cis,cis-muconate cycloisomerase